MYAVLIAAAAALQLQSDPPRPTVPGYHRQPTPHAYFILQATDMLRPGWPDRWWPYELIVANASIQESPGLARAHSLSDCDVLLYRNFSDIEVADSRSGSFWDELEAVFDTTFCIRDLDDGGRCVRMGLPEDTIPTWIPFPASIDSFMVHFDAQILPKTFDGIYLDECRADFPSWRAALLPANFDIDGDDVADDLAKLEAQRDDGRALLAERIRASIGPERIFIANTAGDLAGGGCFNGITIEGVGGTISRAAAVAAIDAQRAVSVEPHVNVVWKTLPAGTDSTHLVASVRDAVIGIIGQ